MSITDGHIKSKRNTGILDSPLKIIIQIQTYFLKTKHAQMQDCKYMGVGVVIATKILNTKENIK